MISLVVAADINGVIGKDNALPWKLKGELQWFKTITVGKTVVMGRKTFESLGSKPLPNRKNVVLSRGKPDALVPGVEYATDIVGVTQKYNDIAVIGGGEIYSKFLPYADLIYITRVQAEYDGDTYFHLDETAFNKLSSWPQNDGEYNIEVWGR